MQNTSISFELFNYCNGSCSGCMLSSAERKYKLDITIENIKIALNKIHEYGKLNNCLYQPVFSFGDVFQLEESTLFKIFELCNQLNMPFGITVTGVDESFSSNYLKISKYIYEKYPNTIIDLTVDPHRLNQPSLRENYIKNLKNIIYNSRKFHIQVLLSQPLMNKYNPIKLQKILSVLGNELEIFLSFSPTKENLIFKRYGYDIIDAYNYSNEFYSLNKKNKDFKNKEIKRFIAQGKYSDFLKETFHISHNLNVYPVSYSIFGDVIMDERNKLKPLGNLLTDELKNILKPSKLIKLDIINDLEMLNSPFNCSNCSWIESCSYYGIGMMRKIYKDYEAKIGHCYGPGFNKT